MKIAQSVVLITGANRGIGKSYVEEFLKAGAKKIYLGVRDLASVEEFAQQNPEVLIPLQLDVTNEEHIKNAASEASDVNILINNAGVLFFDDLKSPEAIDNARKTMDVNFFGPLLLTQRFAPILKNNGGGALITVSSIVGHVSMPAITTYCASKYAVQSLILNTRAQLASQGTQVIGVYPGPIETDMAADLEMEKFPPEQVALETIKAIENGTEDVFPDAFSQSTYQAFRENPKAIEEQMRQMVEQQEAA
jgi:NAD(P)-dependent dehydrogenase (short-subunit alcohol dehydrogenase family)